MKIVKRCRRVKVLLKDPLSRSDSLDKKSANELWTPALENRYIRGMADEESDMD